MNYKFNITQLDDHVGNRTLRYVKFVIHCTYTVIAPDYFASVNHCTLYTLHYGGCDGDPLIPSSFHSFLWIPTLLHIF